MSLVIAIDGPSGSGKSTLSRRLAEHFGLAYLDTGSTYRAATIWAVRQGIDLDDQAAVAAATRAMPLEVVTDPHNSRYLLDGEDVTDELHTGEVSSVVTKVAINLEVRAELKRLQREIIDGSRAGGGVVAEGRDVTSVVAPDADVRILLIASPEERLARRSVDRHGTADAASMEATKHEVHDRDASDSTVSQFMEAPDGVVTLDNSAMVPDESFAAGVAIVERALRG